MSIIDVLLGEISLGWEGIAFFVLIVALLIVLTGAGVASYVREWNRQRTNEENKDRELLKAIQSVHNAMQTVCERVQSRVDVDRDHHHQMLGELREIGTLVLDVEKRLTNQVEETRRMIRPPRRDGQGHTRIDINGGQNNIGDNDIGGDQRHERRT